MDPQIEMKDLVVVRAIAQAGGVSHAARVLNLSQSAVSHHLSRVEGRLGVALFERVGRRLVIAGAGRRIVALAEEVLPRVCTVERELRSPRRTLRMATQCYTTYHWFPGINEVLAHKHPKVELRIVLEATRDPLAALDAGEIDLAIAHTPSPNPNYARRIISRDELLLVMAPTHPLASRKRLQPKDLHPYTLFVFDSTAAELRAQAKSTFPNRDGPPKVHRVPVTDALVSLVRSGQGLTLLPGWIARPHIESGDLATLPLSNANLDRTWRALYRKNSSLLAPLRDLVSFLVEEDALC